MIGTHRVMIYPDPAAAGWVSLATNPGFDASMTGWKAIPWGSTWTWYAGGVLRSNTPSAGYQGIRRDPASPIARPAGVARLRVRARFTLPSATTTYWGVRLGRTAQDAFDGALGPNTQEIMTWDWSPRAAGTYAVEGSFDVSQVPADLTFLSPTWHANSTTAPVELDYLDLAWTSGAGGVDLSCWVDEVAIAHGRGDTTSAPEASACTIGLTTHPVDSPLPAALDVGAVIIVSTTLPGSDPPVESVRFGGRVTDVTLGWDDAGEDTPDAGVGQVTAIGPLADLGRRVVGDQPWPQELDGARVARVLTLAGYTLDPIWSDPGTVQIIPRDVDSQPALDVATETAQSAGGMIWQTKSGEIRYADANHRRGIPASTTLDACDILVTPSWLRNLDGLINEVSIGYGVEPEGGGEQARYTAKRQESIDKWGRYGLSATTELAALADAQAMGNLLLTRNSQPVWVLSTLPLDLESMDGAQTQQILGLDVHALVNLTGLPAIGSAPTQLPAWVEGWSERLAWGVHDLTLVVSDYCRTAPPPRWNDLNPATTWNTVTPSTLTWDQAACLGPPVNRGYWDDVPASLRWDQVAAATTWDTWK